MAFLQNPCCTPFFDRGQLSSFFFSLVQCCFGLAAQACISCVTAKHIAIGEGGNSLLKAMVSIFVRVSAKNRYSCNVSQQVLSKVVIRFSRTLAEKLLVAAKSLRAIF